MITIDGIFDTIKKMLGIGTDDTSFDTDILILINSVVSSMRQFGVGPETGIEIDDDTDWDDLLGSDATSALIVSAKEYIYLKVRMIFDTPTGPATEAFNNRISEIEWRICSELDRIHGL